MNIQQISDVKLRQAAEAADSNGENAYNNVLDSNELSVFIKQATKLGCGKNVVMDIVNQVGIDEQDKEAQETVNELNDIVNLKDKIAARKNELAKRNYTMSDMESDLEDAKPKQSTKTGENIGFWTGAVAGTAAFFKAAPLPNPILRLGVSLLAGLAGGALGAVAGMGINKLVNMFSPKTHTEEVLSRQIDQYKESNIEPLKSEIDSLEKELKAKEEEFYE